LLSLRTLVLTDDAKPVGEVMFDDPISVTPDETEEDVAADIFKYDLPAMPVVDEHGMLLGIVTVDDAWGAIEEDVSGDKAKTTALKVVGIVLASVLFLGLYTLVLLQILGYPGR
ncbi:MAG: CBS domain-containing protein, partial [Gordonibacter sp.]